MGQPAQQGADPGDADGLRCPERTDAEPGTTTYRVFTGPRALFEEGQRDRLRRCHRRDVEHAHGRRGQGGGVLDQARCRARHSTRRPSPRSTARLAPRRRLQRPVRRRLGPVLLANSINVERLPRPGHAQRGRGHRSRICRFPDAAALAAQPGARGPLHVDPRMAPQGRRAEALALPGVAGDRRRRQRGPDRRRASRSPAFPRRPPAACWSRCCSRPCRRHARPPAAPSARNNLKQMALAMHQLRVGQRRLPQAGHHRQGRQAAA